MYFFTIIPRVLVHKVIRDLHHDYQHLGPSTKGGPDRSLIYLVHNLKLLLICLMKSFHRRLSPETHPEAPLNNDLNLANGIPGATRAVDGRIAGDCAGLHLRSERATRGAHHKSFQADIVLKMKLTLDEIKVNCIIEREALPPKEVAIGRWSNGGLIQVLSAWASPKLCHLCKT